MTIVRAGIHQQDNCHYEMPLPFREETVRLPNNKDLAVKRLRSLHKRLQGDKKYRTDYIRFMNNVIGSGYAERVPSEEVTLEDQQIWYIPHHAIYHPKKPDNIRVVDCSATYKGESLNQHMLQ